jgi:hypothetical protein
MSEQKDPNTNELEDAIICPHCKDPVLIEKLNCCIFRHGIMKDTLKQIDPHCPKEECDRLFSQGLIYGCGKPFKVTKTDSGIFIEICEYI